MHRKDLYAYLFKYSVEAMEIKQLKLRVSLFHLKEIIELYAISTLLECRILH